MMPLLGILVPDTVQEMHSEDVLRCCHLKQCGYLIFPAFASICSAMSYHVAVFVHPSFKLSR
ncbi:hypothetical protein BJX63DRAFT_403237 [Aspergillus granulosus]|uniref:Uncharacterized protein n=1 Tax=Aspergillus granulosus TaxID=176169 RepID=A0ABR4H5B8_9EURO